MLATTALYNEKGINAPYAELLAAQLSDAQDRLVKAKVDHKRASDEVRWTKADVAKAQADVERLKAEIDTEAKRRPRAERAE